MKLRASVLVGAVLLLTLAITLPIERSTTSVEAAGPLYLPYASGQGSLNEARGYHCCYGWDFNMSAGTPVRAAAGGTVEVATNNNDCGGNFVNINHGGGVVTQYLHLQGFAGGISGGANVQPGQIIGYAGSTGCASGAHLHFAVIKNGAYTNPGNANNCNVSDSGVLWASCPAIPFPIDPDPDGDGIPNSTDNCDPTPEDFDGYQDTDGCPDRWRSFAANATTSLGVMNGYALDSLGRIYSINGAPPVTPSTTWDWEIARAIAVVPNTTQGYVLDGWGGLHPFGGAPPRSGAYWTGWDIARDIVVRSDGSSGYVLDGFGGVHPFGGAPEVTYTGYWGWDIARSLVLRPDGQSGYVLDGFGGIHPFGGAPTVTSTGYWANWDIARSLVLRPDGDSGYVVDGFGGVHPFGNAPGIAYTGYWGGSDVVRDVSFSPNQNFQWGGSTLTEMGTTLYPAYVQGDADYDGYIDASDNCSATSNYDQLNRDLNFIDNPAPLTQDDTSRPNSDAAGDACDDDDDNDGLTDGVEAGLPGAGCVSATGELDPMHPDTDGDGYMDGAECAIGTDPSSSASKPTAEQCRVLAGAATVPTDTDGDLVQDRIEVCGYGTSVSSQESDGDGREDQCEIASLNTLPAVNSLDQLLLAQAIIADLGGPFVWNADLNKDGANNSADQLLMAQILIGGGCPAS